MALRNGIQCGHAHAGRYVGPCLRRQLKGQCRGQSVDGSLYVDNIVLNFEMGNEQLGRVDIGLNTAGHEHAYHAVFAERLDAERRRNRAVLTTRDTYHGVAAASVLFKEFSYPFYAFVLDPYSVKHFLLLRLYVIFICL